MRAPCLVLLLSLAISPASLRGAASSPVFLIDGSAGEEPVSLVDGAGRVVAAWVVTDGGGSAVLARRFATSGLPLTPAVRVSSAPGASTSPSLALLSGGGFAVAWNHSGAGDPGDVLLRAFDAQGRPSGPERRVSVPLAGPQQGAIHPLPSGGFAAVWTNGERLLSRRFSPHGAPAGALITVRSFAAGEVLNEVVTGAGDVLLASWRNPGGRPCPFAAQRFTLSGAPLSPVFGICSLQLSETPAPPFLAAAPDGVIAVWDGVYARRFSRMGDPRGTSFRVDPPFHAVGAVDAGSPRVAVSASGVFAVAWLTSACAEECEGIGQSVFLRAYEPGGGLRYEGFVETNWYCSPGSSGLSLTAGPGERFALAWREVCQDEERPVDGVAGRVISLAPGSPPPPPPAFTWSAPRWDVNEEDGMAVLQVRRIGSAAGAASVRVVTEGGTATPWADYRPISRRVSWVDGDAAAQEVRIPIVADGLPEPPEWLGVTLSEPRGGEILSGKASVHLDDPGELGPRFCWGEGREVLEGHDATVSVERSQGRRGAISIHYETEAGIGFAEEGRHYLPVSGTLHWADGDGAPKTFTVPLPDNDDIEDMKGVMLRFFDATGGARVSCYESWLLIDDDELSSAPGLFVLAAPWPAEVEEGDGAADFLVRRVAGLGGRVTVRWRTVAGTATAGRDFVPTSGVLTWGDSDLTLRVIRVRLIDDGQPEPAEVFTLELFGPLGGAALRQPAAVRQVILDDDR